MKNILRKIGVVFFCFVSTTAVSQDIQKTLIKAFSSRDSSDYYFKKAKKQIKNSEDAAQYYFCKNARCTDYEKSDSSFYYGKKAIELFHKNPKKDWNSIFSVYNNFIKVYKDKGQYDKAINTALQSIKKAEKEKRFSWVALFDNQLSLCYHDFESYEKGVYYGKKSLKYWLSKKETPITYITSTLNAIAINYDDWNKPDSALYYHQKNLKYYKGTDTLMISGIYNNIGNTLLKQKKYKEAQKWITSALLINDHNFEKESTPQNLEYYYERATVYTNLAHIAFKLNQISKAKKIFEKAYFFAKRSQNAEKLRDVYVQRIAFNKAIGNTQQLAEDQESYIKLRDSIFDVEREKNYVELEAKYQNEKKEKELLLSKTKISQKENELKVKNTQSFILFLICIGLGVIAFLIYRQQKLKNRQQQQEFELKSAISKIETQNKLQEQRLQISRDLHDNIGSQLTFIISSIDTIKFAFHVNNPVLDQKLSGISAFARTTIIELRDTIWAMNKSEITFEDLQTRIHNFVDKAKEVSSEIQFSFLIDGDLKSCKFTSVEGMNVYRTIQEAIHNSVKYSKASLISVTIKRVEQNIKITISDDGIGFEKENIVLGNGIQNMKKRISDIHGEIDIQSIKKVGTTISIILPNHIK